LLQPAAQSLVIGKVARTLKPGGRFLFTAPKEPLAWLDAMTGRPSQSLGAQTYERLLREAGLTWVGEAEDEGGNRYYFAEKRQPDRFELEVNSPINQSGVNHSCSASRLRYGVRFA
jgi:hypothetical protein